MSADFKDFVVTAPKSHHRILLIGPTASGKSKLAFGFPNPVILNADGNSQHGLPEVPLYNTDFIDKVAKRGPNNSINIRDCVTIVCRTINTIPAGKTLILDSLSMLETMYNNQEETEPKPKGKDKNGNTVDDTQALFGIRKKWYEGLLMNLFQYKGTVIVIVHEFPEFNKDGLQTGKFLPAITGQMKYKLAAGFNNIWRSEIVEGAGQKIYYKIKLRGNLKMGLRTSFPNPPEELDNNYAAFKELLEK